jgi:hypothetical protein
MEWHQTISMYLVLPVSFDYTSHKNIFAFLKTKNKFIFVTPLHRGCCTVCCTQPTTYICILCMYTCMCIQYVNTSRNQGDEFAMNLF